MRVAGGRGSLAKPARGARLQVTSGSPAVFAREMWYFPRADVPLLDRRPQPGAPSRRTRAARAAGARAAAALAAFALAFASLLGAAHEATTAHVRCAAHGELVDSAGPAGAAAAGPSSATLARPEPTERGHGDEHCLLASALRQSRIAPRAPAIAAAITGVAELLTPGPAPVATRAAPVFRFAPKTSPPA